MPKTASPYQPKGYYILPVQAPHHRYPSPRQKHHPYFSRRCVRTRAEAHQFYRYRRDQISRGDISRWPTETPWTLNSFPYLAATGGEPLSLDEYIKKERTTKMLGQRVITDTAITNYLKEINNEKRRIYQCRLRLRFRQNVHHHNILARLIADGAKNPGDGLGYIHQSRSRRIARESQNRAVSKANTRVLARPGDDRVPFIVANLFYLQILVLSGFSTPNSRSCPIRTKRSTSIGLWPTLPPMMISGPSVITLILG